MGFYLPDPYNQPEEFGLTPVASLEEDEPYQFDILQVWKHEDGTFYYASDSGCSCPSPFEDFTKLEHLEVLDSFLEFEADVRNDYIGRPYRGFNEQDVSIFLQNVKREVQQ